MVPVVITVIATHGILSNIKLNIMVGIIATITRLEGAKNFQSAAFSPNSAFLAIATDEPVTRIYRVQ